MPFELSRSRANFTNASSLNVGSVMSRPPGLTIHQPFDAEPSPPTLSFFTKAVPEHVSGWDRYLTLSCMPLLAASVTAWVHDVPASMAMNTSGFLAARVVIGSVIVGADASTVSLVYSMRSFRTDDVAK